MTGLCGWSWDGLRASVGGLKPLLGPLLAVLSHSWASAGGPGSLLAPMLAILGCSWASAGDPGSLLDPLSAVLGRSWSLAWRSWAALGVYVGGPGPSWGLCGRSWEQSGRKVAQNQAGRRSGKRILAEKWPKPEREGDQVRDQGPLDISVPRSILRIFSIDIYQTPGLRR